MRQHNKIASEPRDSRAKDVSRARISEFLEIKKSCASFPETLYPERRWFVLHEDRAELAYHRATLLGERPSPEQQRRSVLGTIRLSDALSLDDSQVTHRLYNSNQ